MVKELDKRERERKGKVDEKEGGREREGVKEGERKRGSETKFMCLFVCLL